MKSKQTAVQVAAKIVERILNDALESGSIDTHDVGKVSPDIMIEALDLVRELDYDSLVDTFAEVQIIALERAYQPRKVKK